MKKRTSFYTKYFIKTPIILIILWLIEVSAFIYLTSSTQIESIKQYYGCFDGNKVIINEIIEDIPDTTVYVFKKRDEKIYKLKISKIEIVDFSTIITFDKLQNTILDLSGNVTIETIAERNTLLSLILGKKMKYIENNQT